MPTKKSSTVSIKRDPEKYVNDLDGDVAEIVRFLNRGFRPDQVTTAERNALTNLYAGLIVFNTSTSKLNVYTGSGWEAITSA